MRIGIIAIAIFIMLLIPSVAAQKQIIDINSLKSTGIVIHSIEIIISMFICVMALRFFHITKPYNFFLFVYLALGFFIINSLLYIIIYLEDLLKIKVNFANVYLGSRISLIAMLLSLGTLFFYLHREMKRKPLKL